MGLGLLERRARGPAGALYPGNNTVREGGRRASPAVEGLAAVLEFVLPGWKWLHVKSELQTNSPPDDSLLNNG